VSCATAAPAGIPTVIPAAAIVQPQASAVPEPGTTPFQYLFSAVDYNEQTSTGDASGACNGAAPANCKYYWYQDFALNSCTGSVENTVWTWQNANDETSFSHEYPGGITSANRLPNPSAPTATPCPSGSSTQTGGYWNPNDAGFATEINTVLAAAPIPAGWGLFEDTTQMTGQFACGSSGQTTTTEYGIGYHGGITQICNQIATGSSFNVGIDHLSALGVWAARINYPVWMNGTASCCGDPSGCSVIASGHCHDPYYADLIDDAWAYHNACARANGNLKYLLWENVIMHKVNGGVWPLAGSGSLIELINSMANVQNDPACNGMNIVDFEYGYGTGGPGDLSGSAAVRTLVAAMHWLVPDPATQIPDRVLYEYLGITCNSTVSQNPAPSAPLRLISNNPCVTGQYDGNYFFEETLVPYSPIKTVQPFVWNGTKQTVGGGCDSVSGDMHGASDLLVQCVGTAGIYCQQYRNLFINGVSKGPAAACVNTSTTSEPILSSWFTTDAITTYNYSLNLAASPGSLQSVNYGAATGGTIALLSSYTVNCTGSPSLANNVASFNPVSPGNLAGQSGIILLNKGA
jgi:hypothetical protein